MKLTLQDIQTAEARFGGVILNTPCAYSQTLSNLTGAEVYLKFENLQFTASFKERGALNKLLSLPPELRERGVIAMSAGNHAQGVAYHAKKLGIPAVIVMPLHTPEVKVKHTRSHGAEVILHGETFLEAAQHCESLCVRRQLTLIHPFDDPLVMAGQGTVALEILRQQPEIETLIVPVGGGGLLAGMAVAAKAIRPDIELIGVQSDRFPAMAQILNREPVVCGSYSVAEGIAVKFPGRLTTEIIRALAGEIILVSEEEIETAIYMLLEIEKTVVEGAGAVGLAGLLKEGKRFKRRKVALMLSGGNIDMMSLASIIQRRLVRSGQIVRVRVEMRDVPGALSQTAALIGSLGANIIEVQHQRAFSSQPLQTVMVDFVIGTRGPEHCQEILKKIRSSGAQVSKIES